VVWLEMVNSRSMLNEVEVHVLEVLEVSTSFNSHMQ